MHPATPLDQELIRLLSATTPVAKGPFRKRHPPFSAEVFFVQAKKRPFKRGDFRHVCFKHDIYMIAGMSWLLKPRK